MTVEMQEQVRIELEELRMYFGDEHLVPLARVAEYLHKDPRTLLSFRDFPVKKRKGVSRYDVSITALARWLAS